MRKMRLILFAIMALLVITLAALYFVVLPSLEPTNPYDRLRTGMTVAQVEAILGGPADATGKLWNAQGVDGEIITYPDARRWQLNRVEIWVAFNGVGIAMDKNYCYRDTTLSTKLRRWLRF